MAQNAFPFFIEREIAGLTLLIVAINGWNRIGVSSRNAGLNASCYRMTVRTNASYGPRFFLSARCRPSP